MVSDWPSVSSPSRTTKCECVSASFDLKAARLSDSCQINGRHMLPSLPVRVKLYKARSGAGSVC